MKPLLLKTLVVGCLMGLVAVGFAQNENRKKKGQAKGPTTELRNKLASAELGADLTEKVKKIIDENEPKLKELQGKVDAVLTDEQKAARRDAQKAARQAGKKGKEAQDEVNAALKLTADQQKKMDEAQKELNAARGEMNKAIAALLTDEQQEKLGVKAKGKGKKKKNA
jgi:hypothetical protein